MSFSSRTPASSLLAALGAGMAMINPAAAQTGAAADFAANDRSGASSSHGVRFLGTVAYTTASGVDVNDGTVFSAGEDIYGPFEAGFSSRQDGVIAALGCADPSKGYIAGGMDVATAKAVIAHSCGIELPRFEGGRYIGVLDACGGHTHDYHFHEKLSCLYDATAPGHSTKVGTGNGQDLFGKWESTGVAPELDACGGHYGVTPESNGEVVYHYHVQDAAPFTFGCWGPNDDGSLVTVAQCRDFYDGCGDDDVLTVVTKDGAREYDAWCPCFDANGNNIGEIAELAVFSAASGAADHNGAGNDPEPEGDGAAISTPGPTPTPTTPAPTRAPATQAPTPAPAQPTRAPTTPAPTRAPTTPAPTRAPATPAPTPAPATPVSTRARPTRPSQPQARQQSQSQAQAPRRAQTIRGRQLSV